MTLKTMIVILLLSLVISGLSAPVRATPAGETVRGMLNEVMAIQTDPSAQGQEGRAARKSAIKKIILKNFDVESMAKQALGNQWDSLGAKRQGEFREIFQDLFLDSYTRLVLDFLKKEKIDYAKEEVRNGQATVKTVIQRTNEEIPVDYLVNTSGSRPLVRDVNIDGVSIVENYHRQFSRVIKQESYEGLLKRMRMQQKATATK